MNRIDNKELLLSSFEMGISLFLGAGFSIDAKSTDDYIPTGIQLRNELLSAFNKPDLSNLSLDRLARIIENENPDDFENFIRKRLCVSNVNNANYYSIQKLNLKYIYTTNLDNLIHKIFQESKNMYINDITLEGPIFDDLDCINYVPLHGSIMHEQNDFVFSNTDIANAFRKDPDMWSHLSHGIQEYPTIFWGYNLDDSDVLSALSPYIRKNRSPKYKWIVLYDPDQSTIRYFESEQFGIIIADTKEFLKFLNDFISPMDQYTDHIIPSVLKHYLVPNITQESTPRPINQFFLGEEPIWNDIWSNRIPKLSFYNKIMNDIAANYNILFTGINASGKTTLLMQLANDYRTKKHKLFFKRLSKNKVELILRNINSNKYIFFIDNFSDVFFDITLLLNHKNIQIICTDSDYRVNSLANLPLERFKFHKITDINLSDYNHIIKAIPNSLIDNEIWKYDKDLIEDDNLSLFDLIEKNIRGSSVKERFTQLYKSLNNKTDEVYLKLLVFISYVNYCGTIVSLDMIISFFNFDYIDYNEIRLMIKRLGEIIKECTGNTNLIDSDQDYFYIRSNIICLTIIDIVHNSFIKDVIIQFHNNLFPYKISNYHIFQKKAYNADLITKVFNDYNEGIELYQRIFERDNNYYIKQQGALFLLRKKQYSLAFKWIDEALTLSNGRNFTINNSHAIILFHASIDDYSDEEIIRRNLDRAMDILKNCYRYDLRKDYHALKFTDFAIQYANRYSDDKSIDYLIEAEKWINEIDEERLISKIRYYRYLKRELKRII